MDKELVSLLPRLTLRRVWNSTKVTLSFYISKLFGRPMVWGKPISLSYEPTNACNLRCPECPSGLRDFTRPVGTIDDLAIYKTAITELCPDALYLLIYFQGEPYLNKQFFEMTRFASDRGYYVATSTNAHYLTDEHCKATIESGLDKLIISIDGTTQESYEQYRIGGTLEKVLEGTRNMVKWKKELGSAKPYLVFQFVVFSHNEHQIEDVKALGKAIGVDKVTIKTAQVYDYKTGNPFIPINQVYSRYEKKGDTYEVKSDMSNHCWHLWSTSVITWDNRVVPCCFDKDAKYQMGNVGQKSFDEIWHSERYNQFRQQILLGRKNIDICQNCTEGLKIFANQFEA